MSAYLRGSVEHGGKVWAVAFHPQGDLVATGSFDGKLRVIRVATRAVAYSRLTATKALRGTSDDGRRAH